MKIKDINSDGITFDNGATLTHYHSQDCCEHVYADWESLKTEVGVMDHNFATTPIIEFIKDSGIRVEGFFVPCYNSQNGYYSSQLELVFNDLDNNTDRFKKISWDISNCVNDQIS